MFRFIGTYCREILLNKNTGMFSFVLHRLTGLGLLFFFFPHLYSVSHARHGAGSFDSFMRIYDQPLFHVGEYLLLLIVMFHMLNGLKIAICDLWLKTRSHKFLVWVEAVVFFVIALVSLPVFFPSVSSALGM